MYKARVFDVSSQANPAGVGARRLSGSVILALFLAGYLGQQYLPPPKARVIGLDLGTTFCSVGIFQAGSGEVEVIADEQGRLSIPSTVAFTDTAVLVGHEAADVADSHPENTIYDAKRFIGKIFEPEALEQESARYPFKVRRDETTIPHPRAVFDRRWRGNNGFLLHLLGYSPCFKDIKERKRNRNTLKITDNPFYTLLCRRSQSLSEYANVHSQG